MEVRRLDSFTFQSRSFLVSGGSKRQLALWELGQPCGSSGPSPSLSPVGALWELGQPLRLIGSCLVGSPRDVNVGHPVGDEASSEQRIMSLRCLSSRLTVVALPDASMHVVR